MATAPVPEFQGDLAPAGSAAVATPDDRLAQLSALLTELDASTGGAWPCAKGATTDEQLAAGRLGVAGSLFTAVQCKHPATAAHSLRVALICSAWATAMEMDPRRREQLEVAALLHDIGVIGTPDHILLKPGRLDSGEAAIMARARSMSLEILRHSCNSPEVLAIVENLVAWYDGSRSGQLLAGEQIPLPARMIAIVEAFDAMTTDRVYRPAMSLEHATAELFRCAGTQFDPQLVQQFAAFREGEHHELQRQVAGRWLEALDPGVANSYWNVQNVPAATEGRQDSQLFQAKLLENMYDAVVFVDARGEVTLWNHGMERLTGIAAGSVRQRKWNSEVLQLSDEKGRAITEADCPVLTAIQSGVQSLRRLRLCGRNGRSVAVDSHFTPVIADNGATLGAIVMFHDASSEISLEQQCHSLAEKATRDPLTQVANRAEFDRVHAMFVSAHQEQQVPCSLMICDLDEFKQVNDNFGHQVGDEVIKSLAMLLKGACHPGDLVARYGGEEFVMLCADCGIAAATRRAEQIRKALAQMPQPKMRSASITVSFGVTQIQPGDTPETMLRRADRALLTAKANGRNQVVQLGSGSREDAKTSGPSACGLLADPNLLAEQILITPVPISMTVEKLRGFVADHQARIVKIEGNQVQLELVEKRGGRFRRLTDRPVVFEIEMRLDEQRYSKQGGALKADDDLTAGVLRTRICVVIRPQKGRDRRHADMVQRAQHILASIRSYLMATTDEQEALPVHGPAAAAKPSRLPWWGRKG
jgi:diguanylate cyclase (GGDEF)-like protein/PAS domain S-box-containing protein